MAAPSQYFLDLETRFNLLKTKFMDPQLALETASPLAFQADSEQLAAFRLLIHAEFEDYLERKARERILSLQSRVDTDPFRVSSCRELYPLAMYFEKPLAFDCPFDLSRFRKSAVATIQEAKDFVDGNNGIKATTFMVVSLICGKSIDELDSTLAGVLSDFGEARGAVAHKSVSRVPTILAPSAELKAAQDILAALKVYFY